MEFETRDGVVIYDGMMEVLDPKLVKMQFQTEVINIGFKASTYFKKYPGRFISSHMSDWTDDKKAVPIGKGMIDWPEFFEAAKIGGVQHFLVEMDRVTFKDSAIYLKWKASLRYKRNGIQPIISFLPIPFCIRVSRIGWLLQSW